MAKGLSKSRYVQFCQCEKALWLQMYKPEVQVEDAKKESLLKTGLEVGELAKKYFGEYAETTAYNNDGSLNINAMLSKTLDYIVEGKPIICEAAFSQDGNYCAVDILKREEQGAFSIYEVKSSTSVHPEHILDVAYQKYVLESCGMNIKETHVLCLNSNYVLDGDLDIHSLFSDNYIDGLVEEVYPEVAANVKRAHELLASEQEPCTPIGMQCGKAAACPFWQYCTRNLSKPNVFDIGEGMHFDKMLELMDQGLISFQQLYKANCLKNKYAMVVNSAIEDTEHLDKAAIRAFLETVQYPLYHLDFETMQPAIPTIQGTRPYQQIPFQYSLHIQKEPCGLVEHKEFLAESGTDPMRPIAEALVRDIPMGACSMAYNMSFERTRLKELAEMFPDLAEHLLSIRDGMVDLMVPFQHMDYYTKAMQGSYSIKYVLPALFPNDPELDYHSLEDVHNGGEAMTIFPQIQFMPAEDQKRVRANLLKYCGLDTYAMVKVLGKLYEVSK